MELYTILIYFTFLCAMGSVVFNVINQIKGIRYAHIIEIVIYALGFGVTTFCLRFMWGFWPQTLAGYGPLWMYGAVFILSPVAYCLLKYNKVSKQSRKELYYFNFAFILFSIMLHLIYVLHIFETIIEVHTLYLSTFISVNGYIMAGYLVIFTLNYFIMLSGLLKKQSK